jgi:hypothetical protein
MDEEKLQRPQAEKPVIQKICRAFDGGVVADGEDVVGDKLVIQGVGVTKDN